ncbi:MAG: M20/M25/M40 family metallo-hydrolase, partial [Gemmatimonadales bacterium]
MPASEIARLAERYTPDMVRFLREMILIPAESGGERPVIERVKAEMEACGFDEIRVDPMGNILGRVGKGKKVIALDAHLDTVGVGDPSTWTRDPFKGELKNGIIYGRGAGDMRGGM